MGTRNKRIRRRHRAAVELRRRLKLPPLPTELSAHVFRRTFITLMIEAGAPLSYVQELVGREDQAATARIYNRVLRMRDRRHFGRAFDQLMADAVPAEAFGTFVDETANSNVIHAVGTPQARMSADGGGSTSSTHTARTRKTKVRLVAVPRAA